MVLILSSCADVPTATHDPDPTGLELELPDLRPEAPSDLELPGLLPGWRELPIEALLKAEVVSFPAAGQVGVCHTQVASPTRPLPFRVHRIEVDLPRAAWEEAGGRTALLQYRRFSGSNGYVVRVARCRIPDSPLAVEALSQRFASSDPTVTYLSGRAGVELEALDSSPGAWVAGSLIPRGSLDIRAARGLGVTDLATFAECPEGGDGSEQCPILLDEVENEPCYPGQEYDPELDECYCENGSNETDCWLEPDDPYDGDGWCDPDFENCDDGGGGGGGGSGGAIPSPDEVHPDTTTVPKEIPDCDEGPFAHWSANAWCVGQEPSSAQIGRIEEALDAIEERGSECKALADRARDLLAENAEGQRGMRLFDYQENPDDFRGASTGPDFEWMVIDSRYVDEFHSEGFEPEPVAADSGQKYTWPEINLQWVFVHEMDHNVHGADHVSLPGGGNSLWQTPLSPQCSGLSGFQEVDPS